MKKQSGFTIIELVIVVVILGFLAVTAIPKFLDLTDQAKQANIEGMAGGFATGVSLVRAQWEAEGRPQNSNDLNSVNYDGVQVLLTTENDSIRPGYIVGLTDGAGLGTGFDDANCVDIWNNLLQQPPNLTSSMTNLNDDPQYSYFANKTGSDETSACQYYLKESLSRGDDGDYEDPGTSTAIGNSFTYEPATSSVIVYVN